ncbi:hypothetical protein [Cohnella soli]|uniref:Uncharacterized protein n=1 Tax=Cohnella soli TaxID=425005 RepID=A0ABW0HPC0_9BACL
MNDTFRAGKIEDGYVYGYLFRSALFNGQFVLDGGEIEYRTNFAEMWNGEKYVLVEDLTKLPYSEVAGNRAKVLVSQVEAQKRTYPNDESRDAR